MVAEKPESGAHQHPVGLCLGQCLAYFVWNKLITGGLSGRRLPAAGCAGSGTLQWHRCGDVNGFMPEGGR